MSSQGCCSQNYLQAYFHWFTQFCAEFSVSSHVLYVSCSEICNTALWCVLGCDNAVAHTAHLAAQ